MSGEPKAYGRWNENHGRLGKPFLHVISHRLLTAIKVATTFVLLALMGGPDQQESSAKREEPFGLSLSKPCSSVALHFDRLSANGELLNFLADQVGGCHEPSHPATPPSAQRRAAVVTQEVSIRLGEMGAEFAKRYPGKARVEHQPAGVDFYSVDWDARPHGVVTVENGKHPLQIENVLGLQTLQDLDELKPEGLNKFSIYAGVSEPDRIDHDEARLKVFALLQRALGNGWAQVIERSEPRLRGKARQDYMFATSNLNGLDAAHVPTLEEWMRIENRTPWSFYANGLYMDVSFTRDPGLTDPAKPGAYMLTFEIKTEAEYFRGFASPDTRLRWKEVVPPELAKMAEMRAKKEAELRAKGVAIDEEYRDPPTPSFQ